MFCLGYLRVEPEVHAVVARFRWRDEKKREQRGSKKGKLGRGDEAETERKGKSMLGRRGRGEGNRFRTPKPWREEAGSF